MKTIRIEKLVAMLGHTNLEEVKSWCGKNEIRIWKVGILEFVIESEFLNAFEKSRNVELKTNNYDEA